MPLINAALANANANRTKACEKHYLIHTHFCDLYDLDNLEGEAGELCWMVNRPLTQTTSTILVR